jgi:hypothetical protein
VQQSASAIRAAIALARAQLSMLALAKRREMVAEAARMRSAGGTVVPSTATKVCPDTDVRQSAACAMRCASFPRLPCLAARPEAKAYYGQCVCIYSIVSC